VNVIKSEVMKRLLMRFLMTRDKNIERLVLTTGEVIEPATVTELNSCGYHKNECTIKHLGGGRYLHGYFDGNKAGSWSSGSRINRYEILYPSIIKVVLFK
jgi:hypothetical protein